MLPDGIGLVTIENFNKRSAEDSIAAIEDLLEQGAWGVIFDLRYNPGGYADELVDLLDYLLPEGELFRRVDFRGDEMVDMSDAACLNIPMVVMVNGDTYSAAEFFAAALSEYGVATVVGMPTTGKGYFQTTYKLSDNSAVTLSVGKYFTPNGISLAEVGGIVPDVVVEVDELLYNQLYADLVADADDPQLAAAIEALKDR
jgi:carboxyl-terminal processing protease